MTAFTVPPVLGPSAALGGPRRHPKPKRRWKLIVFLAVLLLVLLVTACADDHKISGGTVVDKEHRSSWVQPIVICGKTCSTTMVFHPEDCDLVVRGIPTDGGEPVTETFDVDCDTYDAVGVGDEWSAS